MVSNRQSTQTLQHQGPPVTKQLLHAEHSAAHASKCWPDTFHGLQGRYCLLVFKSRLFNNVFGKNLKKKVLCCCCTLATNHLFESIQATPVKKMRTEVQCFWEKKSGREHHETSGSLTFRTALCSGLKTKWHQHSIFYSKLHCASPARENITHTFFSYQGLNWTPSLPASTLWQKTQEPS